jgi:hypothetical protein
VSVNRSLMLQMEKVNVTRDERPYTAGGRTLKRTHGKDGGGKRRNIKKKWYCIGCEAKQGQKCKARHYKIELNMPATYLREGGFTPGELGQ